MTDKIKKLSKDLKKFQKNIKKKSYDEILKEISIMQKEINSVKTSPEFLNSKKYNKEKQKLDEMELALTELKENIVNIQKFKSKWSKKIE